MNTSLVEVLLRFRTERVAVSADVEEMFLQVSIPVCDRNMFRVLWWPTRDLTADPVEYQLTVHPFGARSSPFCAAYALQRTADKFQTKYTESICNVIRNNFYVDDCLVSVPNVMEAKGIVNDITELLSRGGFRLRKWVSNNREVLKSIPISELAPSLVDIGAGPIPIQHTLGIQWDAEEDCFCTKLMLPDKPLTKRGVLSCLSSLYDPMGFVSPWLLHGKQLLQTLCNQGVGWDEPLEENICRRWSSWINGLRKLGDFRVPRCIKPMEDISPAFSEMHVFCDASESGYGVVAYSCFTSPEHLIEPEGAELKKMANINMTLQVCAIHRMFIRYSSWTKLLRAVAWLLRFKFYVLWLYGRQLKENVQTGQLHVIELHLAESVIIKVIQGQCFANESQLVDSKNDKGLIALKRDSAIHKLCPILIDGVLRIGGRLSLSNYDEDSKHPIILPKRHHVVDLIIRHHHEEEGHCGHSHVLTAIRRRFWIINGGAAVKRVLRSCFTCRRLNAPKGSQLMAPLPAFRVNPGWYPFTNVGLDYFGPMFVKRGRGSEKRYGCLFTCLQSRAVHIEVAHSLTTDSFMLALSRFIARRGKPTIVCSDNGSNFVAADRELKECVQNLNAESTIDKLVDKGIDWRFNPPSASHRGGVWERLIRSTRRILNVICREQRMDDEMLLTLMIESERILNNRPLIPASSGDTTKVALTPNDLLILRTSDTVEPGVNLRQLYTRRWMQTHQLVSTFWKRWSGDYVQSLQSRQKWLRKQKNLSEGDIVLVVSEGLSRSQWPLGIVQKCETGGDGLVRTVELNRPVSFDLIKGGGSKDRTHIRDQTDTRRMGCEAGSPQVGGGSSGPSHTGRPLGASRIGTAGDHLSTQPGPKMSNPEQSSFENPDPTVTRQVRSWLDSVSVSGSFISGKSNTSKKSIQARANLRLAQINENRLKAEVELKRVLLDAKFETEKHQVMCDLAREEDLLDEPPNIERHSEARMETIQGCLDDPEIKFAPNLTVSNHEPTRVLLNTTNPTAVYVKNDLPRVELTYFDGDPVKYWKFVQQFKYYVESREVDDGQRLLFLVHYCRGQAKEAVEECLGLPPTIGYRRARDILENLFGQPFQVARAVIESIMPKGKPIPYTSEALDRLVIKMQNCEISLNEMNCMADLNSLENIERIMRALPIPLQTEWAKVAYQLSSGKKGPTFRQFTKFISECAGVARSRFGQVVNESEAKANKSQFQCFGKNEVTNAFHGRMKGATYLTNQRVPPSPMTCPVCAGSHLVNQCTEFLAMNVEHRWESVRQWGGCFSCLNTAHAVAWCTTKNRCNIDGCRAVHHRLLHHNRINSRFETKEHSVICGATFFNKQARLGIVPVEILTPSGSTSTYAFVDNGSDITLIRSDFLRKNGITGVPSCLSVTTVNGVSTTKCTKVCLSMSPLNGNEEVLVENAYSVEDLPMKPVPSIKSEALRWPHLSQILFDELDGGEVNILLGCDVPEAHWVLDQRLGTRKQPFAIQTIFGWMLCGPLMEVSHIRPQVLWLSNSETDISDQIQALYNSEFGDTATLEETLSVEDEIALSLVKSTTLKTDGHFQVPLPWRPVR
ncbi:UNVERIFIED_CONTAM: hypothetical protein B566_EDAN019445, partial [Ephemera danica]